MKTTKEEIIKVATLLLESDINCTLEDIANKAGISRRTLHRYFDGKQDLIIKIFETLGDAYIEGFLDIIWAEKNAIDTLKDLLHYDLELFSNYSSLCYLYENFGGEYKFEEKLMLKIHQEYVTLLEKICSEGHCHKSLNPKWLEAYYFNLIELGNKQLKTGINYNKVVDTIWLLFWNGINK